MIQKPKGTFDVIEKAAEYRELESAIHAYCANYNYKEIRTPMFEHIELFTRGVGESSDIVTKEMYDFLDKGKRHIALRPEGTAPVVRSFIENKLYANADLPVKLYYTGPMFRYERQQEGRYRQFNQFGVEALGSDSPIVDVEVISLFLTIISAFGLQNLTVKINTLGDEISRSAYRDALKDHFKEHLDGLCDDCKTRYEKNPLRILDCKVDRNKDCFKTVPKMSDFLTEDAKTHFEQVLKGLLLNDIKFELDESLVRGLDYYTHTVFEIESRSMTGSQNVIAGGGRYNKLVEELGGPRTACMGAAMGMERFLLALQAEGINIVEEEKADIYLMSLGEDAALVSLSMATTLRSMGYVTEIDYANKSLKAQFKRAERVKAKAVVIFGETELKEGYFNVKIDGVEQRVKNDELIAFLERSIGGNE